MPAPWRQPGPRFLGGAHWQSLAPLQLAVGDSTLAKPQLLGPPPHSYPRGAQAGQTDLGTCLWRPLFSAPSLVPATWAGPGALQPVVCVLGGRGQWGDGSWRPQPCTLQGAGWAVPAVQPWGGDAVSEPQMPPSFSLLE